MTKTHILWSAVAAGALAAAPAWAGVNDILIGFDSKVAYTTAGQGNVAPGTDAVLVMDVSNPAHPRIRATLSLVNSLLGPPTNQQVTPDGRLGLVANSVNNVQDGRRGSRCRTTSCMSSTWPRTRPS